MRDHRHPPMHDYRGYAEVRRALIEVGSGPGRLEEIGRSVEGEPLLAVEVGPADAAHVSIVVAGLHAMEWIGVEVGLGLLARLAASPPKRRKVLFFPLANPDGFRRAEANRNEGRRRFVRANARGVDLNRNWPTHWKRRDLVGHIPGLSALGTAGPHARSEPEVDAICERLDAELTAGRTLDRALSLHSFGRVILHPYGGRWRRPATYARHLELASAVQRRLPRRYRIIQCGRWLPGAFAHGTEIDHLHAHCGATALLVECSRGGLSPVDPSSWLQPLRWYNPAAAGPERDALVSALDPFLRGVDPD